MATSTIQNDFTTAHRHPAWRQRKLNTLIFFVTSHCNSTCDTCFYWDDLNKSGDLSWDEIVKLSKSTPQITDLWFSGGEPTLRGDLEEIINLFVRNNGVRYINLPTNGLKPSRIFQVAQRCLEANPQLELHVNIALDGLRESHDTVRGVPGNFERAVLTARNLRNVRARFGERFETHFNTVITRDNLEEILILAEWALSERIVDGHYFNLIRGDARNPALKDISPETLKKIYAGIASVQERYANRWATGSNRLVRWLKKVAYLGTLTFHHRTQLQNAEGPKAWAMPCTAGETSAVIDFDGRVRSCELRKPVGDLRQNDMNFKVFWESKERQSEPGKIACDQCWCSHVCFIHDSMRYSWRAKLWEVPKNYFLRKVW